MAMNPLCPLDEAFCETSQECLVNCADCEGKAFYEIHIHTCIQRGIFQDWAVEEAAGVVIWFLVSGLASAAGVGGGGIYVPVAMLLLEFTGKAATALSQASIFGACLAGLLINLRKRHPLTNRPLIDFDLVLLLAPMEMSGAMVGVAVQRVTPEWLVLSVMAIVLSFIGFQTLKKGVSIWNNERRCHVKKESVPDRQETHESEVSDPPSLPLDSCDTGPMSFPPQSPRMSGNPAGSGEEASGGAAGQRLSQSVSPSHCAQQLQHNLHFWASYDANFPYKKAGALLSIWAGLLCLMLVRGGKGTPSMLGDAVPVCGGVYWGLFAVGILGLCICSIVSGYIVVQRSERRRRHLIPAVKGDVMWTMPTMLYYSRWTFVAGFVAGLIGTGGGMILGPLLLYLNILPQVQSATMTTLIVMTSSVAATLFLMAGSVSTAYAGVYFSATFVGSLIGKSVIDFYVQAYRISSLLILILGGITSVAAVMVCVVGLVRYSEREWLLEDFSSPC